MHEEFASLSGDRNPMHMDEVAARRTQAGSPVVHGVHTLLWALDSLAATGKIVSSMIRLRGRFLKWVYLDDETVVTLPRAEEVNPSVLQVEVLGMAVCTIDIGYGEPGAVEADVEVDAAPTTPRTAAAELSFADLHELSGNAFVARPEDAAQFFPHLAAAIGATAVAEIASCSYIVGMEAPGLHSMFSRIDVTLADLRSQLPGKALSYNVSSHDIRFSKAKIAVNGAGIQGMLEVFMRDPPMQQASMEAVASRVSATEFEGMRALVIGGSRGLGELTAKIIAAGGGSATVTYALGKNEAKTLVEEITGWGAKAQTLPYDVRLAAEEQLGGLVELPTHLFYFATGTIYKPKPGLLSSSALDDFVQFYLLGFYSLCKVLLERKASTNDGTLHVFYPSTVFLEERPAGMTEYAMVKAAGEQLCADMNKYLSGIYVTAPRLPKLPTDQTAGVLPERQLDTVDTLLPLLRNLTAVHD